MVGGNYHQGLAVFFGPLEHLANDTVEVEELLAHVTHLIAVTPVIYLGTFYHEEEAFFVVQHLEGLEGAFHEHGAAVQGRFEVVFVVQAQEFAALCTGNVLYLVYIGITLGLHFLDEVAAVAALIPEMGAAATDEVYVGIHVLGSQAFLVLTAGAIYAEVGRSGVVDTAGYGNARLHAFDALGPLQVGFYGVAVGIQGNVAVLGLDTGSQGCAAGRGIGYQTVYGVGLGITGHRHLQHIELAAVGHVTHRPLVETGTVTNHENNVLDLLALRL